jgi:hypothetical protein
MRVAAALIEFVGLAVVAFGLYLLAPWAGIVAAGVAVLVVGLALGAKP